jgi:hypothetical protein
MNILSSGSCSIIFKEGVVAEKIMLCPSEKIFSASELFLLNPYRLNPKDVDGFQPNEQYHQGL